VARKLLLERTRGMRQDDALLDEFASQPLVRRDVAESVVSADAVRRVLAGLTPREREIVLLWAWEGLAAAELGSVLGCTAATAAVRLHRARRRFRAQYSVEGHDSTSDVPVRTGPRKAVSTDETF
jgi:RNA polymerase sigma-70 factor (ECF subfamily)